MLKECVLIADDNRLNQELLSAILGNKYDYLYASDGVEVINLLDGSNKIDILLLDINMPNMDGFEVLKILNQKQYIKETPVIIISSENDANFVKKAYEFGATDYINRPFNSVVVQHRVENTLMMYSNQKRLMRLVETEIYDREKINNSIINIFSNIIELKNHESGSHTLHVQTITNILLHELVKITDRYKLSENDISLISSLSALHDIGKIYVPEAILNKPGKLTDEEWKIMKDHTINGYNILCNANIDQDNEFVETAKAICRWHHEKYDGKGYPDGLVGENIPISAQVVSMADVYDALTSERCYKAAYTHDEAIEMILNGECGSFNPLLLQCLNNISGRLKESLVIGLEKYNYQEESLQIANEILETNDFSVSNSANFLLKVEQAKSNFYKEKAKDGISFEYNVSLHKVTLINNYLKSEERSQILFTSKNELHLISDKDWVKLSKAIKKTTRKNNEVEMNLLVKVNGVFRWHKLNAMTIWFESNSEYYEIVGRFTDIHEEIVSKGLANSTSDCDLKNLFETLKATFPFVRLVDPINSNVLAIDENGNLFDTDEKCFKVWGRNTPCEYCTSKETVKHQNWLSKLEVKEGKIFAVLSKYIVINNSDCVLEIAFPVDDEEAKSETRCRLMNSLMFLSFYRDSLTKAYTRTYIDDFRSTLDKADGIALIDVDQFKKINDSYGHPIGDIVLQQISKTIMEEAGEDSALIRYGGDEFLLIFETISEELFEEKLQDIKDAFTKIEIPFYKDINLTISVGGAYKVNSMQKAITIADREMYKDKAVKKK